MHDIKYPVTIINDVAVVTAPDEIDLTTADQLRQALLQAATNGHATIVVDMSRTTFCDSTGISVLVRAHRRALADAGTLRLVIPVGSVISRIFTITSMYRFIPRFDNLDEALRQRPAAVIPPPKPRRPSGA